MAGHNSGLALFYKPVVEDGEEYTEYVEYRPTGELNSEGAITFNITGNDNRYIDLSRTHLKIKCKVVQADGSNIPANTPIGGKIPDAARVGPVNLFLHSLWRQVDLSLQQQVVSAEVATRYPYKAYIETLLGYSEDAKETQLEGQLFFKDRGDPGNADPIQGTNSGLLNRATFIEKSKILDMEGPLFIDLAQQSRYIIPGVQLGFKLWPSTNQFRLMSNSPNADYRVIIVEASLKLCMVNVKREVVAAHMETIKKGPALYYYHKTDVKAYNIAKGQFGTTIEDVYQGEIPYRIVVGLVDSAGFNGSYGKNPYDFRPFDCSFIGFYVDGKSVPTEPLTPNYSSGNYMSAYMTLFADRRNENFGNYINRYEYPKGNCLYVFNVCQNGCDNHGGEKQLGHTRLEIKLNRALGQNVTMIVYAIFPARLDIDQHRNLSVN